LEIDGTEMTKREDFNPPKESVGDHAHTLVRAGIGSIPVVRSAATELFQKLITPSMGKRCQKWMQSMSEGSLRQIPLEAFEATFTSNLQALIGLTNGKIYKVIN
jgi:hypothetical protein